MHAAGPGAWLVAAPPALPPSAPALFYTRDSGNCPTPIPDMATCEQAVAQLQLTAAGAPTYLESQYASSCPSACFQYTANSRVYYNNATQLTTTCSATFICICMNVAPPPAMPFPPSPPTPPMQPPAFPSPPSTPPAQPPPISWAVQTGGSRYDVAQAIASDGGTGAFVVGRFEGSSTMGSTYLSSRGSGDIFTMHVTADGVIDWAINAGGSSDDYAYGVAPSTTGGALVTGRFGSTAYFGPGSTHRLSSSGSYDAFVLSLNGMGAVQWVIKVGGSSHDQGNAIAHDGSGGALVTGFFGSRVTLARIPLEQRQQRRLHSSRDQHGHHHMGREGWRRIR